MFIHFLSMRRWSVCVFRVLAVVVANVLFIVAVVEMISLRSVHLGSVFKAGWTVGCLV